MGQMKEDAHQLKVEQGQAMLILILTILGSGWGVVIAAVLSKQENLKKNGIIFGVICVFTSWLIVGWVFAIMAGLAINKNSE